MYPALLYLLERGCYRVLDFFHHWYIDGTRGYSHSVHRFYLNLDHTFAVWITLRHFFEPLYGDYTIIGYILGFFFRSLRVLIGGIIYLFLAPFIILGYCLYAALPVALILYAIYAARTSR